MIPEEYQEEFPEDLDETLTLMNQMQDMKKEIINKINNFKETSDKDKEEILKIINYFI